MMFVVLRMRWRTWAVGVLCLLAVSGAIVWISAPQRVLPPEFASSLHSPAARLNSVKFTTDGRYLVAGSADGRVVAWDWPMGEHRVLEPSSHQSVVALALSKDELLIASGLNGQVRGWQLPEFKDAKLKSPGVPVTAMAFRQTPMGRAVLLGLADGRIATLSGGQLTLRQSGHRGVKSLLLANEQEVLISAGSEGKLVWFDLKTQKALATVAAHRTEISELLPSPDGRRFVSADWNGRLCCWDSQTRQRLWEAQQPDGISSIDWLGERLVSGGWDGKLRVWTCSESSAVLEREIATGRPIHDLAVVPGDEQVATVSASHSVELWSIR